MQKIGHLVTFDALSFVVHLLTSEAVCGLRGRDVFFHKKVAPPARLLQSCLLLHLFLSPLNLSFVLFSPLNFPGVITATPRSDL